jgi:hypothetical protein
MKASFIFEPLRCSMQLPGNQDEAGKVRTLWERRSNLKNRSNEYVNNPILARRWGGLFVYRNASVIP